MRGTFVVLGTLGALGAQLAHGHHSTLGLYDPERVVEMEGVVTAVRWRNPHPSYTVAVRDENGETVEWHVEVGGAVTTLRLRGVDRNVIRVGDRIRIAGESSTRNRPELFAHNFLLESGQEVLLGIESSPRWPAGLSGNVYRSAIDPASVTQARRAADGIFRVWSVVLDDPESTSIFRGLPYPLTEAAATLKSRWDPRTSPYTGCGQRGMPYLMNTPYPIEFLRRGHDIVLRMESNDAERLIHMDPASSRPSADYSPFGHSRGRWEGRTLVVETDGIDAAHFYGDGTPQSALMRLVERFTLSDAEDRLDYRITVDDPETFTETLELTRYWIWRPEIRVEPYDCQE